MPWKYHRFIDQLLTEIFHHHASCHLTNSIAWSEFDRGAECVSNREFNKHANETIFFRNP